MVGCLIRSGMLVAALMVLAHPAHAAEPPRAKIDSGWIVGRSDGPADAFLGVPYVAPPVGALRWRAPHAVAAWSQPRAADRFGLSCPQTMGQAVKQGEDCLTLSVWTPHSAERAPVMVWIHGGAHRQGDSSQPYYDGAAFARDGVVLVSINYRLGKFGFFAHPAIDAEAKARGEAFGNFGLLDQIAALLWVKRNAAAFGGDPNNVTIFGESAGAVDVMHLVASAAARGLFVKAIAESGPPSANVETLAAKEAEGREAARIAGLGEDATADQLRALPLDKVPEPKLALGFGPFVDGVIVKEAPSRVIAEGRGAHVPLIIGSNSEEGTLMQAFRLGPPAVFALTGGKATVASLYPEAADDAALARAVFRDMLFAAPSRRAAQAHAKAAPTRLYYFSYTAQRLRQSNPGGGVQHGGEIPYVFDSWKKGPPAVAAATEPKDQEIAALTHAAWVRFAKTGDPSGPGLPWPALTAGKTPVLVFDDAPHLAEDPQGARLDAFNRPRAR